MHQPTLTRDEALALVKQYNKEPFHIQHAITVEAVMRWFVQELGHGDEVEYWGQVGLLHDIDFEGFPEQHCVKAQELLKQGGVADDMIYSICCHGYGICIDWEPKELMEKVLYASDELSGLIGAAALMRPSKSTKDMELKSLKKKFKDKKFAAGCSRDVISGGAEKLGWDLDELLSKTLQAMQENEDYIISECEAHC
jgi:predicted hydrolase (HD superfamily)